MKRLTTDGEIVDVNCDECIVGLAPQFKTPYNHDRDAESARVATLCTDESKTDQSFKEEADINFIMDRIGKGHVPNVVLPEHFGDAFAIPSLLEARTRIAENNATFYNLPAKIREEFQNDPSRWEDQVIKDVATNNFDNLERMGLDMSEVRKRYSDAETIARAAEDAAYQAQLDEIEKRLAKRSTAPQGGLQPPGAPAGGGAAPAAPPTRKD